MAYRLEVLGVSVNVLMIGRLIQGSGDYATAFRIRQYFDNGKQSWAARNLNSFDSQWEFFKFLRDNRIDCIFGINAHVVGKMLTGCSVPFAIILSGSELVENVKNPDDMLAMTSIVENARLIIVNTEAVHSKAMKTWPKLPREKLLLVPRAIITRPAPKTDISCLDKYQLDKEAVIFLMVTRLTRAKDPLQIVPAFTHWHQLHEKHPFLVIVGAKVDVDYYREFSEITDGCPGIIYVGPQNMRDTHRLIADSYALVNSAVSGGTSTCVLEAMDLGIPVLLRKNNIHSALIEHETNGLLYTFPEDFIEKAETLLASPILRKNLIENARDYVTKNLDCSRERNCYGELAIQLKNGGRRNDEVRRGSTATGEEGKPDDAISSAGRTNGNGGDSSEKKVVRFRLPNARTANGPEMTSADQVGGSSLEGGGEKAEGGKSVARKMKMKSPRVLPQRLAIARASDVESGQTLAASAAGDQSGLSGTTVATPDEEVAHDDGHLLSTTSASPNTGNGSSSSSRTGSKSSSSSKERQTKVVKKRTQLQRRDSSPLKTTTTTTTTTLNAVDPRSSRSPRSTRSPTSASSKVSAGVKSEEEGGNRKAMSSSKGNSRRPSGNKANLKRQASQKSLK